VRLGPATRFADLLARGALLLARLLQRDVQLAGAPLGLGPLRLRLAEAPIVGGRSGGSGRRRRRDDLAAARLRTLELRAKMRRLADGARHVLAGSLLGHVGFLEEPARMCQILLELGLARATLLLR